MAVRRFKRILLIITVLGLFVRLGCLYIALPIQLTGDEPYYANVAFNIARGNGHRYRDGTYASWPPGNAFLLSLFMDAGESGEAVPDADRLLLSMLIGQVIIGALLVPLAMLLSRLLFSERTAVIAGVVTALYPTFIAYSHYLWAENLFVVLVAAVPHNDEVAVRVRGHLCVTLATGRVGVDTKLTALRIPGAVVTLAEDVSVRRY